MYKYKKTIKIIKKVTAFIMVIFVVISLLSTFPVGVKKVEAFTGTKVIFLTTTGTNTWTVPNDWSDNNKIEVIGAGGGGRAGSTSGARGGGGGAYSSITVTGLTPGGSVTYRVGAGGPGGTTAGTSGTNGGDTFFNRTSGTANTCADTVSVCAKGGTGGTSATAGGVGGAVASNKPAGVGLAGGNAGSGSGTGDTGGGGGGAAGPNGVGGAGGAGQGATPGAGGGGGGSSGGAAGGAGSTNGGAGGNNFRAAGSGAGANATNYTSAVAGVNGAGGGGGAATTTGTLIRAGAAGGYNGGVWTSTHAEDGSTPSVVSAGPGGGGGGAGAAAGNGTGAVGGNGGGYGGGGGGSYQNAGSGTQGIIVITYVPSTVTNVKTVFITTLGTNTWTVPPDWSDDNEVYVVGAGGGGRSGATSGSGGGGGGALSTTTVTGLSPGGSVTYRVGAGGTAGVAGGDTLFNRTSGTANTCADTVSVCAKGGALGGTTSGGAGGAIANNKPAYAGFAGGTGGAGLSVDTTGGGGSAAGPYGAGRVGGAGQNANPGAGGGGAGAGGIGAIGATAGGAGGVGFAGTGGGAGATNSPNAFAQAGTNGGGGGGGAATTTTAYRPGADGSTSAIWTQTSDNATIGPGGGGGGGGTSQASGVGSVGGNGGYGGGGGGGYTTGGTGGQGFIVIRYVPTIIKPTVTTQSASSVTETTAVLNGNITDTGNANATVRGFAWGTDPGLNGGDTATTTENGSFGTGAFTKSDLTFTCNTTYYSRAYASNSAGTSYGEISSSFTTSACIIPINVSGVVYSSEGGSNIGIGKTIKVYKNGTTLVGSDTTDVNGAWSVTSSPAISSGDVVTVYIDGDSTDANMVFISDGTDQTNIDLYGGVLIVRHDTGSYITNTSLQNGAISAEDDMIYSTSTTNAITLDSNTEFHVYDSDTYMAVGTLTTQGSGGLHLDNSSNATLGTSTNAVAGNVTVDTGATLNINAATTIAGDVSVAGTIQGTGYITVSGGEVTGNGSIIMSSATDLSTNYLYNVKQIFPGNTHTCAVTNAGNIYCWGKGDNGTLGDNNTGAHNVGIPVRVLKGAATVADTADINYLGNVAFVDLSSTHTCAVTNSGNAYCWGRGDDGQLGDNNTGVHNAGTPIRVLKGAATTGDTVDGSYLGNVAYISAGGDTPESYACAFTNSDNFYCWGDGVGGKLGDNNVNAHQSGVPVRVLKGAAVAADTVDTSYLGNANSISASSGTACASTDAGNVYCWGIGDNGKLSDNNTGAHSSGVPVRALKGAATATDTADTNYLGNIASVSTKYFAACAMSNAGNPYCWGYGIFGGLGDNNVTDHSSGIPVRVVKGAATVSDTVDTSYLGNVKSIANGGLHSCASTNSGNAYCWGWGLNGPLGDNDATDHNAGAPVRVLKGAATTNDIADTNYLGNVSSIVGGGYKTCASTNAYNSYCWGQGDSGELGDNNTTSHNTPTPVWVLKGAADSSTANIFKITGTGGLSGNGNWQFSRLILGSSGVATTTSLGSGSMTVSDLLLVSNGQILDAGVSKTWNLTASDEPFQLLGTFLASSSSFVYQGISNATVTPATYYNLDISPPSGSPTYLLGTTTSQTININNNFTIGGTGNVTVDVNTRDPNIDINGTLTIGTSDVFSASNSASFTLAGGFNNNGTFTHNNGTIEFDGSDQSILSSDTTFYNLNATTPDQILRFKAGTNFGISSGGSFVVSGTTDHLVTIRSDTSSNQWLVNLQGTENITYANIIDSGCHASSLDITLDNTSQNGGGNNTDCWIFPTNPPTVTTQDPSSVTATTAVLNGNITATGGVNPTVRGFAWGTSSTMAGDTATTTENGNFTTGAFTNTDRTYTCNTTYYSRAYATNSVGTSYGTISNPFTTSACVASITVSGTIYDTNESAPLLSVIPMKLAIGTDAGYTTNSSVSDGTFSFSSVTKPATSTIMTLWLNTDGGTQGSILFSYGDNCIGGNCTELSLYKNHVVVATTSSISTLSACDNDTGSACSDTDIGFTAESSLDLNWTNNALKIASGSTFTPGGNISAQDLDVAGTYVGGSETVALTGTSTALSVTGTFTPNNNTVSFRATSETTTIPSITYKNLEIVPASGSPEFAVSSAAGAQATWYSTGGTWNYRKSITVDNTKVSGTGDLTDFPILVDLTDSGLQANAQTDGGDIVFTSSDGTTKLSHEIEIYTTATGRLTAWVRIPTLDGDANTSIYMYYGDDDVANQWDIADGNNDVWDANYKAVYHFGDGTTLNLNDSTSNNNDGTAYGDTAATTTDVKIGGGIAFDGNGDYVVIPHSTSINIAGSLTIQTWARITTYDANRMLITKPTSGANGGYSLNYDTLWFNMTAWKDWGWNNDFIHKNNVTMGSPRLLVGRWDAAADPDTAMIFVDGASQSANMNYTSTPPAMPTAIVSDLYLGQDGSSNRYYYGTLDELRISATPRSDDWVATEFNNQSATSTFYSIGNAEPKPSTTMLINGDLTIGGVGNATLNLNTNDPDVDINGNVTIGSGDILSASNSGDFRLAGNFTNNGTFTANSGTIILDTTGVSTLSSSGNINFYNLISTSSGKTIKFQKHSVSIPVFTIDGALTITGQTGNPIYLESDTSGSQWLMDFSTTRGFVANVSVKDAGCPNGYLFVDLPSTLNRGGNGSCWFRTHGGVSISLSVDGISGAGILQSGAGPTDGLVGYWNFDEGYGETANDLSGNSYSGGITGATWTTGKIGNALSFNGTGYLVAPNNSPTSATDNWTLSAWIKPNLPQGPGVVVYNGNDAAGYGIVIGSGGDGSGSKLSGLYGSVAWVDPGITLTSGDWVHVAMARRNGTAYFYKNGVETSSSSGIPYVPTTGKASIGFQYNTSNTPYRYFNGIIDEVHIYNRALTASEILILATPPALGGSPPPVEDDGGGGTVVDDGTSLGGGGTPAP